MKNFIINFVMIVYFVITFTCAVFTTYNVWVIKQDVRQIRCDLVETEVAITTQLDSLRVKIDKPVWWR